MIIGNFQISLCDLARNWEYELDDELMADLVQGTLDNSVIVVDSPFCTKKQGDLDRDIRKNVICQNFID